MTKQKSLIFDAVAWIVVMVLAGVIAFNLLQRDKQRHFGALAYGGFPEFSLKTTENKDFNRHRLKAAVWAVHQGSGDKVEHIAGELALVAHSTASGKRHLNILTFLDASHSLSNPVHQYQTVLPVSNEELNRIFGKLGIHHDDIVLLIDQDSVIRGRYDFSSPDDFRSFRQDLLRIL